MCGLCVTALVATLGLSEGQDHELFEAYPAQVPPPQLLPACARSCRCAMARPARCASEPTQSSLGTRQLR